MKDYPAIVKGITTGLRALRKDIGPTMQGFSALSQGAMKSGALDPKVKELIALAIGLPSAATLHRLSHPGSGQVGCHSPRTGRGIRRGDLYGRWSVPDVRRRRDGRL